MFRLDIALLLLAKLNEDHPLAIDSWGLGRPRLSTPRLLVVNNLQPSSRLLIASDLIQSRLMAAKNFSRPKFDPLSGYPQGDVAGGVTFMVRWRHGKIVCKSAGVRFESDVFAFIDLLASKQKSSRCFITNAILSWYEKWLMDQKIKVDTTKIVPVIHL